jgi:hypothetical protein
MRKHDRDDVIVTGVDSMIPERQIRARSTPLGATLRVRPTGAGWVGSAPWIRLLIARA